MGIIHSSDNNFSNIDFSDVNPEHVIPDDFKKRVVLSTKISKRV